MKSPRWVRSSLGGPGLGQEGSEIMALSGPAHWHLKQSCLEEHIPSLSLNLFIALEISLSIITYFLLLYSAEKSWQRPAGLTGDHLLGTGLFTQKTKSYSAGVAHLVWKSRMYRIPGWLFTKMCRIHPPIHPSTHPSIQSRSILSLVNFLFLFWNPSIHPSILKYFIYLFVGRATETNRSHVRFGVSRNDTLQL